MMINMDSLNLGNRKYISSLLLFSRSLIERNILPLKLPIPTVFQNHNSNNKDQYQQYPINLLRYEDRLLPLGHLNQFSAKTHITLDLLLLPIIHLIVLLLVLVLPIILLTINLNILVLLLMVDFLGMFLIILVT